MIVVTGAPRTGTSMMMQTLIKLGYNTPATKFIEEHKDIIDYNINGFYELGEECYNGIHHDEYKGQAVKLFPPELALSNPKHVDKIIVCKRQKDSALETYREVHKILKQDFTPEAIYEMCYKIINLLLKEKPHIFITFEDIIVKPEEVISDLCEFLEINPTQEQLDNSIKNINYAVINSRGRNVGT